MTSYVLQERGYFWWADDPIPDKAFAPDDLSTGTLEIGADGQSDLRLDQIMARNGIRLFGLRQPGDVTDIKGILLKTGRPVLLQRVSANGSHHNTTGPSYEGFRALTCLVGELPGQELDPRLHWHELELSLNAFEEWLGVLPVQIKQTRVGYVASFRDRVKTSYKLTNGKLTIEGRLSSSPNELNSDALLISYGVLTYIPNSPSSFQNAVNFHERIDDLLMLLTNQRINTPWPRIALEGHAGKIILYSFRASKTTKSRAPYWIRFDDISDCFGKIFDTWLTKREELGSGLYLYLGNRRGMQLYTENRFVNLIWGLEALHRQIVSPRDITKLQKKIDRILDSVERPKDREWLAERLEREKEPSLPERLKELFQRLPIELSKEALMTFATECTKRRNDMSHFGGARTGAYLKLLRDLTQLISALEPLYHVLILQEIGVPDGQLRRLLGIHGPAGYPIRQVLNPEVLQENWKAQMQAIEEFRAQQQGRAEEDSAS